MHKLIAIPAPGTLQVHHLGDRVSFSLRLSDGQTPPPGWEAFIRTELGQADAVYLGILESSSNHPDAGRNAWRDIPMQPTAEGWHLTLTLTEVGFFHAKPYARDERGFQVWPEGDDHGIAVHPTAYRSQNTLYCAFTRLFGVHPPTSATHKTADQLRQKGYSVLPVSGKFRDLIQHLSHVIDTLGCRIVHLLPVNPTPTTYGRFGEMGSPYAGLDLTAVDPALVEFDQRTTGVHQFVELTDAVHAHGARVFLDLVVNHTGWGSVLQENRPEWFLRDDAGRFLSPGAWGNTWEDLVELNPKDPALWEVLADAFLVWCRRGVDGFRCDAGYKVPLPVWRHIIAKVRQEFPDTLFLLEGLGGGWDETEDLLTEGGMQWAYSELFQEYDAGQITGYLDHALRQSRRVGVLVHYSETHDNKRLAEKGASWALFRHRLCALTSVNGAYGFTGGAEWLTKERIQVHAITDLAWNQTPNLKTELRELTQLLADHPCFYADTLLTRVTVSESPVYGLLRDAANGKDRLLILVNPDTQASQTATLEPARWPMTDRSTPDLPKLNLWDDLLGQPTNDFVAAPDGCWTVTLPPTTIYCLSPNPSPLGLSGESYRHRHAQSAWAIRSLSVSLEPEQIGPFTVTELADWVAKDPVRFLGCLHRLDSKQASQGLLPALQASAASLPYPLVVSWHSADAIRVTPVPSNHWLLIRDEHPFRVQRSLPACGSLQHQEAVPVEGGFVAAFAPTDQVGDSRLTLVRYPTKRTVSRVSALLRHLPSELSADPITAQDPKSDGVLLTNGIGGMTRLGIDLGHIQSKYDCLLGANLHPTLPVNRQVLAKRIRIWANTNGFLYPLNADALARFEPGPPACWTFHAPAGNGESVELTLCAWMPPGLNTVYLQLGRPVSGTPRDALALSITARIDLEDRNFHQETKRTPAADHHFASHTRTLAEITGFEFTPAQDRRLRAFTDQGVYHESAEWSENIPHPIEATRGQTATGDAFSPGWFQIPLATGQSARLSVTAEPTASLAELKAASIPGRSEPPADPATTVKERLRRSASSFLVRRDESRTVIAGYPWFLDWGRDTLICARGLLAAGLVDEVRKLLITFGRFEKSGTLPNTIHGANASNRSTSDAPLWYGIVCEETANPHEASAGQITSGVGAAIYSQPVDDQRTVADVLTSIAHHYVQGTPNGIRMDPDSGLIWSPSHFTWMDTNFPAGTPREGYPIEIQALWIRLLRQLQTLGLPSPDRPWAELADRAERSLRDYFWLENEGYYSDCLHAPSGTTAAEATPDNALRSNCLFVISLGLSSDDHAKRCVENARRHLLVPGAVRSLAPLPVHPPLEIRSGTGELLNDPSHPYVGHYQGDEDTQRKPAYHNGTAWTWSLPVFCEALTRAWKQDSAAQQAAGSYLASMDALLRSGCLEQIPEVIDGDAPHTHRGCDAQAWGMTETLRVYAALNRTDPSY